MTQENEMPELSQEDLDEYIDDYYLVTDEGDYSPNENERFLIRDAIYGLQSDVKFMIPTPPKEDE